MNVMKIGEQIIESLLAVVGIRRGAEEPKYARSALTDTVEIRRYGERIAAQTTVADTEARARNVGFRRLAGYIFGGNHANQAIAMTAPVSQQSKGRQIAMTAPVAQSADADGGWVIRFFMPTKWTLETLPRPDDDQVHLVTLPPETVAVLRFSCDRSPQAVASRTAELRNALQANGIEPVGEEAAWFYDPPWTLPPLRRNEIAIPVDPETVPAYL